MLGFFACGNYGDAGKSASGEHGSVGIGSYGNMGCESERGCAVVDGAGNFRQRPEKRFHAGEIEQGGVAGGVFHTRRERLSAIKQGGVCGGFLQRRASAQCEFRAQFGLGLGHARCNAHAGGLFIDRDGFFQRRFAFENGDGARLQFRFGAQGSRHGKIRNVDAGERHGDIGSFSH